MLMGYGDSQTWGEIRWANDPRYEPHYCDECEQSDDGFDPGHRCCGRCSVRPDQQDDHDDYDDAGYWEE